MIVMRPIAEPAVLDDLDAGRFGGAARGVRGYVVMEGARYHGHALFRVLQGVTEVLECRLDETPLVDGAVRACVAAGEHAGARYFRVRCEDRALAQWYQVFCGRHSQPVANGVLLGSCAAEKQKG